MMRIVWLLLVYVAIGIVFIFFQFDRLSASHGDTSIYYAAYQRAVQGRLGASPFEYPVLSVLAFVIPGIITDAFGASASDVLFREVFGYYALVCHVVIAVFVYLIAKRVDSTKAWRALIVYVIGSLILFPFALWRFDVVVALCTVISLWLLLNRQQYEWAIVWLLIAVSMKLYPILLLPLYMSYVWSHARSAFVRVIISCVVMTVLIGSVFWWLGNSTEYMLAYHTKRGLHIESVAGALLLATIPQSDFGFNYGAFHFTHGVPPGLLTVLQLLLGITFCVVWWLNTRAPQADGTLLLAALSAVFCSYLVLNKVFSPQYLTFLLPLCVLMSRKIALMLYVIFAISIYIFPYHYPLLTDSRSEILILLNALRAGLLSALLCMIVYDVYRTARPPYFSI